MRLRKTIVAMTAVFALGVLADVAVTNVVAKQRYPWNGLVDITCKVTGIDGTTNGLTFAVAAVMPDTGDARKVSNFWVVQCGTNSTDREIHANGDYQFLWDSRADLGIVRYTNMVVRVTFVAHEKVQLWEDGPYWATTNIGADEPWQSGYYFWWGDTIGYMWDADSWVASDGALFGFSFSSWNPPTFVKSLATLQSEGWITADNVLAPEHDAAQVHWGGEWRMPTYRELKALCDKCNWNWTTINGVNGYLIHGIGDYASASIFLPAVGEGRGASLDYVGSGGYYWSSVPDSSVLYTYGLYFSSNNFCTFNPGRDTWKTIRPVQGLTE